MDELTNIVVVLHKVCEELKVLPPLQRLKVVKAALMLLEQPGLDPRLFMQHTHATAAAPALDPSIMQMPLGPLFK